MNIPNLVEKVLEAKAKKISRYPCKSNRASSIGYFVPELEGCLRRGVYERTHWEQKELHDPKVQLIFDEGNNQEAQVLKDLAEAGIQVIEQQSAFEWKQYDITGHLDGVIIVDGVSVPVEIKSMDPNIFRQVNSFEDFKKKPWTRSYMAQIQIYMLSKNIDRAIFILKNKSTGELKQIEVALDYDLAEACLKTAEAINGHLKAETLPDRITDIEKCAKCPFKLVCLPEISFGEPLKISDDPDFEKRIDKYLSMKEAAKECEAEYETIKERAKASAGEQGLNIMVGKYVLTAKAGKQFRLNVEVS